MIRYQFTIPVIYSQLVCVRRLTSSLSTSVRFLSRLYSWCFITMEGRRPSNFSRGKIFRSRNNAALVSDGTLLTGTKKFTVKYEFVLKKFTFHYIFQFPSQLTLKTQLISKYVMLSIKYPILPADHLFSQLTI